MRNIAPEYVTARRVLLDALTALENHLDNLILVGAQAVYHHTGDADLNVPLLTTDGDLAINTIDLAEALDAFRILQAIDTADLVAGFASHRSDDHAAAVTAEAIEIYRTHAASAGGRIAVLAASAALGNPTVAPAFAALVSDLLAAR